MSHILAPIRPDSEPLVMRLPTRIRVAPAPLHVPATERAACWMCGTEWHTALLTTGGAGPCCTLDHHDRGPLAA